jgi:acetoacetyl-CoA synthetase
VIEALPEIADSLVIDSGSLEEASGKLWLFVVLRPGSSLDAPLTEKIKLTLKSALSPRHVPDVLRAVAEIPRTLNGKKVEVPIKRILKGALPAEAVNPDTLANPGSLQAFVELARG